MPSAHAVSARRIAILAAATVAMTVVLAGVATTVTVLRSTSTEVAAAGTATGALPAAAGAGATPSLPAASPATVEIPAIGLAARAVIGLHRASSGMLEVPGDARTVGWSTETPTPGEPGTALLTGHADYGQQRGAFHRLSELRPGDTVAIRRADASTVLFEVGHVDRYPADHPAEQVPATDTAELRLITCAAGTDSSPADRIVVSARLTSR
jgi:hypothetical protein